MASVTGYSNDIDSVSSSRDSGNKCKMAVARKTPPVKQFRIPIHFLIFSFDNFFSNILNKANGIRPIRKVMKNRINIPVILAADAMIKSYGGQKLSETKKSNSDIPTV